MPVESLNEKSFGKISYKIHPTSWTNLHGRKSIFVYKNIKKGEKFNNDNIKTIRPHHGLHPKYHNYILNKKSKKNLYSGYPLKLKYVKK